MHDVLDIGIHQSKCIVMYLQLSVTQIMCNSCVFGRLSEQRKLIPQHQHCYNPESENHSWHLKIYLWMPATKASIRMHAACQKANQVAFSLKPVPAPRNRMLPLYNPV